MQRTLFAIPLLLLLAACDSGPDRPTLSASTAPPASSVAPAGNLLRMRIDGVEWAANREISAMVHPLGVDRSVLINGALGRGADEQTFSLILNGVEGPGMVAVKRGDANGSVAQIGNLSAERYLVGGLMLDHALQVDIQVLQFDPVVVEATFSGTMMANDSAVLKIEDGEFRYRD